MTRVGQWLLINSGEIAIGEGGGKRDMGCMEWVWQVGSEW